MSNDPRLSVLQQLGFTPRQAAFLALVALHSGYCLRRQFVHFAGIAYGKNARNFLDATASRHLADRFRIRSDRGYIYHLNARPVYRLLGIEDSRHRRPASSAFVARKVMVLDRVLAQHDHTWLATLDEKVRFFTTQYRIPADDLPNRRFRSRLNEPSRDFPFPYSFPIDATDALTGPVFLCLLTHAGSDDFVSFLRTHAPTFRHLNAWRVLAIAPERSRALETCGAAFADFQGAASARLTQRAAQLRDFFTTRRSIDQGQLATLGVTEIDRFRTLRARFNTPEIDQLYRSWLNLGDAVFAPPAASNFEAQLSRGKLITEYLPHDYSQFGSLPGVA